MSAATRRHRPIPWLSEARAWEIIRAPVVTEKATWISEHNQVAFYVELEANKFEIMRAVEKLFKVKVVSVNTIRMRGKTKQFRNRPGRRSDYKKAIIRLAEGDRIDLTLPV